MRRARNLHGCISDSPFGGAGKIHASPGPRALSGRKGSWRGAENFGGNVDPCAGGERGKPAPSPHQGQSPWNDRASQRDRRGLVWIQATADRLWQQRNSVPSGDHRGDEVPLPAMADLVGRKATGAAVLANLIVQLEILGEQHEWFLCKLDKLEPVALRPSALYRHDTGEPRVDERKRFKLILHQTNADAQAQVAIKEGRLRPFGALLSELQLDARVPPPILARPAREKCVPHQGRQTRA